MEQHTLTYPRVFLKLPFNQQNRDLLMKGSSKVKKKERKETLLKQLGSGLNIQHVETRLGVATK